MSQTLNSSAVVIWDEPPSTTAFLAVVDGQPLTLAPAAWQRIAASRAVVDRVLLTQQPVYGLNRGLGSLKNHVLGADELARFNRDIWHSHAIAVDGAALTVTEVRALLAARVAGMARGVSGGRAEIVQRLIDFLNLGLHPLVRGAGISVGESDLAPMAQIACAFMGEGDIIYQGRTLPALEALRSVGLAPLMPESKDGLALISANAYSSGCGLLLVREALGTLAAVNTIGALSYEGYSAHPHALDPAVFAARDFAGIHACGAVMRHLLEAGVLSRPPRTLQDPLSFRCLVQLHGVVYDILQQAADAHLRMLGSGNDSPLTSSENLFSNGNFESTALALALDQVRLALQRLAMLSAQRVHKLLWSEFSGLPTALFPPEDHRNGMFLNNLSRALSATVAQIGSLALPSGLSPTGQITEGMDDYQSLAPTSLERLREQLPLVKRVLAIEAMTAVRAVDMRGQPLSPTLQPFHDALLPGANLLFAAGVRAVLAQWFDEFPWQLAVGLGMPADGRHWLPPPRKSH